MKIFSAIVAMLILVSSCGSHDPAGKETGAADTLRKDTAAKADNSKEGMLKQIRNLEDTLYAAKTLDKKLGNRAISLYQEFHKYYWTDTVCVDFLFKAGEIADNLGYPQKAVQLYRDCYNYYPQSSLAPYCLFRIGNIYQFTINDYVAAKEAYTDCKREYPKSPVAKDAESLLNNPEKSDQQMIRDFEKKNGIKKEK